MNNNVYKSAAIPSRVHPYHITCSYLVSAAHSGDCVKRLREAVVHGVDLAVFFIRGTNKQIVRNVVEVTAVPAKSKLRLKASAGAPEASVLEPGTRHADVVSSALALGLNNVVRGPIMCYGG